MTTPPVLTNDQTRVLVAFARRQDLADIARATSLEQDFVSETVRRLAGHDRGRAAELLRQQSQLAAPVVAPAVFQAPPDRPVVSAPLIGAADPVTPQPNRQSTAPAGKPAAVSVQSAATPPSLEALLVAAEAHPHTRIRELAVKARDLLDTIRVRLAEEKQVEEAKAQIEDLERKLAEARRLLRPARPTGTAKATQAERFQRIRRWAIDTGRECKGHGRIPDAIIAGYEAAHPNDR